MSNEVSQVRSAFLQAASVLGFAFNSPPVERLEDASAHIVGHVLHFGNSKGCVPVLLGVPSSTIAAIQAAGYYCSQLSSSYSQFDAGLFRNTLNDWGFFGPVQLRPAWYTGHTSGAPRPNYSFKRTADVGPR